MACPTPKIPTGDPLSEFTEAGLSLSPTFIDFAVRWLSGTGFSAQCWANQLSEQRGNERVLMDDAAEYRLQRLLLDEQGQALIDRVYDWFTRLATGRTEALEELHTRCHFIAVVGIPRTGGSYLTSEIFRALAYEPQQVPAAIAHDGFPDARPFSMFGHNNSWIDCLLSIGEYLVLLELFFAGGCGGTRTVVPKKATKAVYAGGLFKHVFGADAEYLITVRHPLACCISTYDKSGGLPPDGRFKVRSAIERWIRRDLCLTGISAEELAGMDYFEAYARYWEQFHIALALSGLVAHRNYRVIPYGSESMEATARRFHEHYGSARPITRFLSSAGQHKRHPQWVARSKEAIARVDSVWHLLGLEFPKDALLSCT